MLIALAAAVMSWGGGFDILHALQDIEFDRSQNLFSLPSALGAKNAMLFSRVLHLCTVLCLAAVGVATFAGTHAGAYYEVGVVIAAGLLGYEHSLVRHNDFSKLDAAFFTMSGVISIVFFLCVLTERLVH